MTKRYSFINRKTGKKAKMPSASTRENARLIKQIYNFKVSIFDNVKQQVIR